MKFVLFTKVGLGAIISYADVVGLQVVVNVTQTMEFFKKACHLDTDLHDALQAEKTWSFIHDILEALSKSIKN